MRIKKINLYTDVLKLEKEFYSKKMEFPLVEEGSDFFTVQVGWTALSFTASTVPHLYHYCFLVPSNQLMESMAWMEKRTHVVKIEGERKIQNFESWNADSFYFYDASGNLAEFIVRYDLANESKETFEHSSVLGFNEIGLPSVNIEKTNSELNDLLGTEFWKGSLQRFGTNGDQEGLFLLPNLQIKDQWFPTNQKIKMEPFELVVSHNGKEQALKFDGELLVKLDLEQYMKS